MSVGRRFRRAAVVTRKAAGGYTPPDVPRHQPTLDPYYSTGRGRWLIWAFVALMAIYLGARACTARTERPASEQVVVRLEREGPRVGQDQELGLLLSGDLDVAEGAVQAAYCVNGWYWATDVTLNKQIVVGTNWRLVRAAELVESEAFDRELVEAVETARLNLDEGEVTVAILPATIRAQFGDDAVSQYLAESSLPSGESARRRFVAYAVSWSTTAQYLYVIDLQSLDTAAMSSFANEPGASLGADEVGIAGSERLVRVERDQCNEIVRSML